MLASAPLVRLLGNRGLIAAERLMGMVLLMLAVELFLDGMKQSLA
nr:MarC family protein [Microbulbifer sediminum]